MPLDKLLKVRYNVCSEVNYGYNGSNTIFDTLILNFVTKKEFRKWQ